MDPVTLTIYQLLELTTEAAYGLGGKDMEIHYRGFTVTDVPSHVTPEQLATFTKAYMDAANALCELRALADAMVDQATPNA